MGADDRIHVVDEDVGDAEALLHEVGHVLGVLDAVAVADEHGLIRHGRGGRLLHMIDQGLQ